MSKTRPRSPQKATKKTARPPRVSPTQAEAVLRKHAEGLRKRGAHAMSLKTDARGPVLEVYVPEDFKGTLPPTVGTTVKGKKLNLRVKARKAPRFKPERL